MNQVPIKTIELNFLILECTRRGEISGVFYSDYIPFDVFHEQRL